MHITFFELIRKSSAYVVVEEDEHDTISVQTPQQILCNGEIAEILAVCQATAGSLLQTIARAEKNICLSFGLPGISESEMANTLTESITLIPPEEYPKGEFFMLDGDDCK